MMNKKGSFGLNRVNALLLAALIIITAATVAYSSTIAPYNVIKYAEFSKSGISAISGLTQFEMFLRIKNTQDEFAILPRTDFTVYYGGENIGSKTIDRLSIPPQGTVPFPLKWDIPESVNAAELFAIEKGGEVVRLEMVMHASVAGMPLDLPFAVEFGENEARVF